VKRVIPWLGILGLLLTASLAWTAAIGDQVTLQTRNRAGVPLHQEPRGTPDFQRVPDGTRATVTALAQDGRWLKLALLDGRTGWVTSRYIGDRAPAPETPKSTRFPGQPCGTDAAVYLKQLVEAKQVNVEIYGVDRYQRLLATIFVEGKDINLAMIEAGLAEVYRGPESGHPYTAQYQAAEEAARSARKGMWIQGDAYESPRAYRKRVGIS
jgi:hypothetical protein